MVVVGLAGESSWMTSRFLIWATSEIEVPFIEMDNIEQI